MFRGLGLRAAALAAAGLVACSSAPTVTDKLVTVDRRDAGSAAPDAGESGSIVEPAACESIPPTDDVGCPDAEFPQGPCAPAGQRCLSPTSYEGVRAMFRCDPNPYNAMQPPSWEHEAFFYDPGAIPTLSKDRVLDTSDCASRPVVACACRSGETAEHAIERNQTATRCQMTNPIVFLTFDDGGCPVRAQYEDVTWGTIDFESCLTEALSGLRFDCATKTTRVVLMTESKE